VTSRPPDRTATWSGRDHGPTGRSEITGDGQHELLVAYVQVGRWFVEQDRGRALGEYPGQADPRLFPTGQGREGPCGKVCGAHRLQRRDRGGRWIGRTSGRGTQPDDLHRGEAEPQGGLLREYRAGEPVPSQCEQLRPAYREVHSGDPVRRDRRTR